MWRLGRRPELDGVRGVAILLVVLAHVPTPGFRSGGDSGVMLFFVLSGFLITALLCEEHRDTGRIRVGAFYRRRALRLLPALFVLIAAVVTFNLTTGMGTGTNGDLPRDVLVALFYVANWARLDGVWLGGLSHTWSLAIEEQFYLVWPAVLLVLLLLPRRLAVLIALIGAAVSAGLRIHLWVDDDSWARVKFGTDTCAFALLLGCALALWLTSGRPLRATWLTGLAGVAVFVFAVPMRTDEQANVVAPILAGVGGTLLIAWLVTAPGRAGAAFRVWPLRQVGRISYGLYLWHIPIFNIMLPRMYGPGEPRYLGAAAAFAIALGFALISYRYVEQPFLRRKTAAAEAVSRPVPAPAS